MFHNLITFHDIATLWSATKRAGLKVILQKLTKSPGQRVKQTWQNTNAEARHWWSVSAVQRRVNHMISGDAGCAMHDYVGRSFLGDRRNLAVLSLGCGTGSNEMAWFATGRFRTLDACDVSPERIAVAQRRAREHMDDGLRFFVKDMFELDITPGRYNVIIFQDALHHLAPVRRALELAHTWLADDGLLVLKEYIGPNRFQWSDQQLGIVKQLLAKIPPHLRRRWPDGRIKSREYRPGRLSLYLHDPSEAAESSAIPEAARSLFEVLAERPYGGTILHLTLKDIAHNFLADTAEVQDALTLCFNVEDHALQVERLPSDFCAYVCRKRL